MHPTLLPEGRGRAPIPWTIIKGLRETGVTAFLLEDSADAGGIIFQERIQIKKEETATTLFSKVGEAHYQLAKKISPILAGRLLHSVKQDLSKGSVWPKRTPRDGIIDFNEKANSINKLIRALTNPFPGAFFYYEGHKIIVNEIKINFKKHSKPFGTIVAVSSNGLPTIAVKDGVIECLSISPETLYLSFKPGTKAQGKHELKIT
jgi:methionyl-tRNA formyltransferase